MKQSGMNKMRMSLIGLFTALTVLTTACQKKGGDNAAPPPPPVNPNQCVTPNCLPGGVAGQLLYGGVTMNNQFMQLQFQVSGDPTGNGAGIINGSVTVAQPYLCSGLPPGSYSLVAAQGQLTASVYVGPVTIGNVQAMIRTVPVKGGPGLLTLAFPNCQVPMDMNFQIQ